MEKNYLNRFHYTKSSNLRNFQFKLLRSRIPTNKFLHTIRVKDNNLCTFCKKDIETLIHSFWTCVIVQNLWKCLERWLQSRHLLPGSNGINKLDAVALNSKPENISLGFCRLAARYYIVNIKLQEKDPNISDFLKQLKHFELVERETLPQKEFYNKWKHLQMYSQ